MSISCSCKSNFSDDCEANIMYAGNSNKSVYL